MEKKLMENLEIAVRRAANEFADVLLEAMTDYDFFGFPREDYHTLYFYRFMAAFTGNTWRSKRGSWRTVDRALRDAEKSVNFGLAVGDKEIEFYVRIDSGSKLDLMERGETDWEWFERIWNDPNKGKAFKAFASSQHPSSEFSFKKADSVFSSFPKKAARRPYVSRSFLFVMEKEMPTLVSMAVEETLEDMGFKFRVRGGA